MNYLKVSDNVYVNDDGGEREFKGILRRLKANELLKHPLESVAADTAADFVERIAKEQREGSR